MRHIGNRLTPLQDEVKRPIGKRLVAISNTFSTFLTPSYIFPTLSIHFQQFSIHFQYILKIPILSKHFKYVLCIYNKPNTFLILSIHLRYFPCVSIYYLYISNTFYIFTTHAIHFK